MLKSPDRKEENGTYTFQYVHPQTSCPMSGEAQTRIIQADTWYYATVLAENEKVLCEVCGHDYTLQQ